MTKADLARGGRKSAALVLLAFMFALALTCGITSTRWIHTQFPGFFVLANRVVASVSLPSWPVANHSHTYQQAVVAVNGTLITSSKELYAIVRQLPLETAVTYTLEKNKKRSQIIVPTRTFTLRDYVFLFGSYIMSGLALALTGLVVWALNPKVPASQALFITGIAGSLFAFTGLDLYGPHWFFRLHIMAEALFPAGLLHLALVFPVDRVRHHRAALLSIPYVVTGGLTIAYELFLHRPEAYSLIHNLSTLYGGLAGVALFSSTVWAYFTTDSHLVRQKIRVVLLGFLSGFALPALLMLSSGVTGGGVSVNYAGFTVILFPLSLGYAIVKHDLFEIDALLKRSVYYLTLTVILTLTYLAFLALLNFSLNARGVAHSPLFPLFFTLTAVLLLNPLKEHLQKGVDRVFFRLRYDPKKTLEATSAALASTLQLEEILSCVWQTVRETMGVHEGGILLLTPDQERYLQIYPSTTLPISWASTHPVFLAARHKKGRAFSIYDCETLGFVADKQPEGEVEPAWSGAQLFVPLWFKNDLIGLIILGRKGSGAFFSAEDIDFLSTLANQSALSIANALAYQEIHEFNRDLEKKVAERTEALARTNAELHDSLNQLGQAYDDLQRSQDHLVRAEKMADLGRLTAGIAHEMNTPLGASLTSLRLLKDLVHEYRSSIGDSSVSDQDHCAIVAEMDQLVDSTQHWMEKAAAHIRSLKLHTRDGQRGEERLFSVLQTIEDTRLLLAHRLRFSGCTLIVSCNSEDPMLHGDPGKLGQVLTNLVGNALDAYKDANRRGGDIMIAVNEEGEELEIHVKDQGCGIPAEHLDRIFDDLFSTKPLGEGTGLGLPIARSIMTNYFGGSIRVESVVGQGSTFILRFPRKRNTTAPAATGPRLAEDPATEVIL
jgi:signal transduction histidine kinase